MASRRKVKRQAKQATRAKGTDAYEKQYNQFWNALDSFKGHHVAEDESNMYRKLFSAKNKARKQAIRKKIKSGDW